MADQKKKKSLPRDYILILKLSLVLISMFYRIFWFNNILKIYVICVERKPWIHVENRKLQVFLWNKAFSNKSSLSSFVVQSRSFIFFFFTFISPGARKEAHGYWIHSQCFPPHLLLPMIFESFIHLTGFFGTSIRRCHGTTERWKASMSEASFLLKGHLCFSRPRKS